MNYCCVFCYYCCFYLKFCFGFFIKLGCFCDYCVQQVFVVFEKDICFWMKEYIFEEFLIFY